jgi:glycerate kinase
MRTAPVIIRTLIEAGGSATVDAGIGMAAALVRPAEGQVERLC